MAEKEQNIKNKVISGLFWKLMENGGNNGIQLIVSIVLGRLLIPDEFTVITLLTIFITIANVFIQSGFSTALIQKKNADETDFSSVFYLSLGVAVIVYILLFFSAPVISDFFNMPEIISVLRVLAVAPIIGSINSIQNAVVVKQLKFRKLCYSSFAASVISGIVGIGMAYMEFSFWALVGQQIVYQLVLAIFLWILVKWRPQLVFSLERIKVLFSFGGRLLLSSLIDVTYTNIYGFFIGKLDKGSLAFYGKGDGFPLFIANNTNSAIQSVMLPALSLEQSNMERLKNMLRRSIVTSSFIMFPVMIGLAAVAEPMILILLKENWLPCVPYLQIMCFSYALWPIHTANLQAINALGRSDIFLKLELIKILVGAIALSISLPFGTIVMVSLKPVVSFIASFINAYPNKKLLNYSFTEQWKDILPSFILSLIMGGIVYSIQFLGLNVWITLFVQLTVGVVIYVGSAYILKMECFLYLLNTVKDLRKK